ncbi:MAG TPA: acyl-CoA desaturase [Mycobacteriales bacterium]|jgi:stearoyl-CoA desaturase (delta-9 desaturase)|nr:acyl-CoA desaturase [Mycobacteriales bacterium]
MTLLADRPTTPQIATEPKRSWEQTALVIFVVVPFVAVLASGFLLWGHGIGLVDVLVAVTMLEIAGHGVTVGFHRYFTHGAFKANRPLRIALAVAGSLAIEGPVIRWVADHRRHHAFSDRPGDPHSPHEYGGEGVLAMLKGLWHAHIGWLFDPEQTSLEKYAPDLLADDDIRRVHDAFPYLVAVSLILPAVAGGLLTWSFTGALTAFFWGSLVRVFVLHHVTWSINSLCHTFGNRPFRTRDKSTNFWPLAVISMGESWHNLHHADPTAARHGVDRFQVDSSARLIWVFEKAGWAHDVRWPTRDRLDKARA